MDAAQAEVVTVERDGSVAVVQLSRPEARNAMDAAMLRALTTHLTTLESQPEVRVLIITGSGKTFSAGADIKQMVQMDAAGGRSWAMLGQSLMDLVEELEKPVIAAINGVAVGGGCELALACDLRYAASGARLAQTEINLGITPGWGGTHRLTRLVGPGVAKELILTGRLLSADEALHLGLVHGVLADEELRAGVLDIAHQVAEKPPLALARAKRALNLVAGMDRRAANALEAELFGEMFGTEDRAEGMRAFLEKRQPQFTGR
ncbi:MAG: crotonase [Dehalococcoidia bacterium]|nr:crotonase [Dehalococcoidia bacterium]